MSNLSKLQKLQEQYNKFHEKLGYLYNTKHILEINNILDKIVIEMNKEFENE